MRGEAGVKGRYTNIQCECDTLKRNAHAHPNPRRPMQTPKAMPTAFQASSSRRLVSVSLEHRVGVGVSMSSHSSIE